MVSKRQKLARKRFKEEHPDLFPKPEPTPPKDPNKKKKKLSKFKRKKAGPKDPNNPIKSLHRGKKHPLRILGMKPGDSCFICKAPDHIAKNCPQKALWEKNKICLFCRRRGHSLKNCSKKNDDLTDKKFCYNCGETGHSLANCPQPLQDGGTRFANCFICNNQGHLSKNCPQNTHGIYPKGGCCKICGGVTHLAKDCPDKTSSKASNAVGVAGKASIFEEIPGRKVTRFISGDDIEDDFMTGDTITGSKDKSESTISAPGSKDKNLKLKRKEGTKVVNFAG